MACSAVAIASYDASVFASLNHYRVARTFVPWVDTVVARLGACIRAHRLEDAVGVCLLHKHFDLDREERLVETAVGTESRIKPMTPEGHELCAYMWRLVRSAEGVVSVFPLEFVGTNPKMASAVQDLLGNVAFLAEFSSLVLELRVGCFVTPEQQPA